MHAHQWLYDRPSCTGLGDRLGLIMALSALASLNNDSHVWFEWCQDPMRVIVGNPLHLKYIPEWEGYNLSLEVLREHVRLPENVHVFLERAGHGLRMPRLVTFRREAPAMEGVDMVSTLYWKALQMGMFTLGAEEYRRAYFEMGKQLRAVGRLVHEPYVLVHARCPDKNTFKLDQSHFCTRRVIRKLRRAGVRLRLISNNMSMALDVLDDQGFRLEYASAGMYHDNTALEDMAVVLQARWIVQHASSGWSAYTSVPAMAKAIPLINTYSGANHRYGFFSQFGELPPEFFSCRQVKAFVRLVTRENAG